MGQSEDDMKIGHREQALYLRLHPVKSPHRLAARAMPVAAGMGCEMIAAAVLAAVDMPAHVGRAAGGETTDHFPVMGRQPR